MKRVFGFFALRMEGQEKLNLILMKEVGLKEEAGECFDAFFISSKVQIREVTSDKIFEGPIGLKNDFAYL